MDYREVETTREYVCRLDHGRDRLDRVELRPFRAAIDAGIDAVMSSHVFFPEIMADDDIPATLSEPVSYGDLVRFFF